MGNYLTYDYYMTNFLENRKKINSQGNSLIEMYNKDIINVLKNKRYYYPIKFDIEPSLSFNPGSTTQAYIESLNSRNLIFQMSVKENVIYYKFYLNNFNNI